MNQQINEQLSALVDGELERDQTRFLLKRIANEPELPLRWTRYHVVRQTLRRQDLPVLRVGFADAVMLRLEHESVAQVSSGLPVWLRWGAGGAIAASVAVAALVVSQPFDEVRPNGAAGAGAVVSGTLANALPVAANAAPSEFRAPLQPLNRPVETAPASFGPDTSSSSTVIEPQLQSYLIRHYQAVGGAGQSAFVPYVLLGTPQQETTPQAGEAAPRNH